MTSNPSTVAAAVQARPLGLRLAAALAGALAVALAAQFAAPLPGTPVPMTLQPLAVLLVGGLLGPRLGALSLVLYLGMGAAGLPVFTPVGLPGFARLLSPTGGYLLAYPLAAAATGLVAARGGWRDVTLAALAGLVLIHTGGLAQLAILSGDPSAAFAAAVAPFLVNDLVKLGIAALVLRRFVPATRALH